KIDKIVVYLKEAFQNNLESLIKETGYPFTRNNLAFSFENGSKLKLFFHHFINLVENNKQQINDSAILDLVNLFIKPIKARYVYHFHGSKETGSLSKVIIIQHRSSRSGASKIYYRAFAHSFPDLIYRVLVERIELYLINESVFLHLIDELFIFEQKFSFIVTSKKPPFLHYSISVINPQLNSKLYEKWRNLQSDHILSNISKCAESSELLKQRFSDTPHLNKFRYPEISYVAITSIALLINKVKCSNDGCLKFNLMKLVITISNEIIRIFIIQLPVVYLFSSKSLCHILIFLNSIHHIHEYLSTLRTEKWFLEGFLENEHLIISQEFDLSSEKALEIIETKMDQVIERYIEYLNELIEPVSSFQYDSSENINNFSSLLLGIKKVVTDYIDLYLCNSLAVKAIFKLNCKIDCFLKRYIFLCNLNQDIYKEEVKNIYTACIIDTFEIYLKRDQICPITTKEIYRNL
ncbi:hypothetical protein MXB_697, partial [Myxobolus squamalis]